MRFFIHKARLSWPRAGFWYAHDDGSPVLKTESTWRHISAFYVRVRANLVVLQWRG